MTAVIEEHDDVTITPGICDTLLWAAGGTARPAFDSSSVPTLLEALAEHRLDARLLARARREDVALPEGLEALVVQRDESNVARVHAQIKLFRAVRERLRSTEPEERLIPLKGFGLFALTGDREHAPFSWDVDIIGADPRAVAAAVEATDGTGYHFHGEEHPYVFAHMDELEVHMHYVVTSIDLTLEPADVDVDVHKGVLEVGTPFSVSLVKHEEMLRHTRPGVGAAEGLDVLGPEMAVLIRLAHLYVGYAMNPQPLPWATIRLEELAQICDYLALPTFDPTVFRDLYERHDARLVTGFARQLISELLDKNPFEGVVDDPIPSWFPANLWWDGSGSGFPLHMPWDARELVGCPITHPDLVDVIGCSHVRLPLDQVATMTLLNPRAPDAPPRYIYHRYHGGLDSVRLALAEHDGVLRATASFPPVDDDQMVAIGWASGDHRYEVFYRPGSDTCTLDDYSSYPVAPDLQPVVVRSSSGPRGVEIIVDLPWSSLSGSIEDSRAGSVPLLFRGRVQRRPWGDVAGGVVLPLRLSR